MWRRAGLAAVAVVVALIGAYAVAVAWQRHVAANNERKASADAEAIAQKFAGEALMAVKQGPVNTESLRTLNLGPGLGMILARQSGSRVVVTFEVTELYLIPGFTSEAEVERCYSETIDRHGSDVTASTSNLDCARIPIP
jgi:hypothetical protein